MDADTIEYEETHLNRQIRGLLLADHVMRNRGNRVMTLELYTQILNDGCRRMLSDYSALEGLAEQGAAAIAKGDGHFAAWLTGDSEGELDFYASAIRLMAFYCERAGSDATIIINYHLLMLKMYRREGNFKECTDADHADLVGEIEIWLNESLLECQSILSEETFGFMPIPEGPDTVQ